MGTREGTGGICRSWRDGGSGVTRPQAGICCAVLATQRLAKLSKNVAAECQNVLVGRTTHVDQARAADVLNISGKSARDQFAREIGRMPTGDFFAYGMAFSREMPTRFTVHKAETMPKAGTKRLSVPPAPHEIQALLPQLADLPAEAEAKAKTVADLQREIADLRKQLRAVPQTITPARERMLLEQIAELQKTGGAYEKAMTSIGKFAANLKTEADKILEAVQTAQGAAAVARPAIPAANPPTQAPVRRVEAPVREKPAPNRPIEPQGDLTGPEQRVLNSLAWFEAIGVTSPELPAVAFMAGYTVNGSFHNVRGKLRGKGLVEYLDGGGYPANRGRPQSWPNRSRHLSSRPTPRCTMRCSHLYLDGPGKRVLQTANRRPTRNPMTNEELATCGKLHGDNGSFHNVCAGCLRSLGLVHAMNQAQLSCKSLFPRRLKGGFCRMTYLCSPYSHPEAAVREQRFHQICAIAGDTHAARHRRFFSPIAHSHPIACQNRMPGGWDFWRRFCLEFVCINDSDDSRQDGRLAGFGRRAGRDCAGRGVLHPD